MYKNKKQIAKYIFLFIGMLIILYFIVYHRRVFFHINFEYIKTYILSYGKYAALCFILIYSIKPIVLVVPASLLSILAGNIFGPLVGLLLSIVSCFFAGTLAFCLSKILGKPFVDRILKGRAIKLGESIEKRGFLIMFIMRLSFIFPYDGLSYAAGLSKMKYSDFILGTILGILPEMIVYSIIGGNIDNPLSAKFILPIIMMVIIAIISSNVYKTIKNKDGQNNKKHLMGRKYNY